MSPLVNTPDVTLALVGVSRDCFPVALTARRLDALAAALRAARGSVCRCGTIIETEAVTLAALEEATAMGCNAAVLYLGDLGHGGSTPLFTRQLWEPVEVVPINERNDALSSLLNSSYNLGLRRMPTYILHHRMGLPAQCAPKTACLTSTARVPNSLANIVALASGPIRHGSTGWGARARHLCDSGAGPMENGELDPPRPHEDPACERTDVIAVVADMADHRLGRGCCYPDILPRQAQVEGACLDSAEKSLGATFYVIFADECCPAVVPSLDRFPSYADGRLHTGRGRCAPGKARHQARPTDHPVRSPSVCPPVVAIHGLVDLVPSQHARLAA